MKSNWRSVFWGLSLVLWGTFNILLSKIDSQGKFFALIFLNIGAIALVLESYKNIKIFYGGMVFVLGLVPCVIFDIVLFNDIMFSTRYRGFDEYTVIMFFNAFGTGLIFKAFKCILQEKIIPRKVIIFGNFMVLLMLCFFLYRTTDLYRLLVNLLTYGNFRGRILSYIFFLSPLIMAWLFFHLYNRKFLKSHSLIEAKGEL